MQFGVFIGPVADDIAGVRQRVIAAERARFDFVSIQDHPYVPHYLDSFSLIANLVGSTSTLRFVTDVANLPLRSQHVPEVTGNAGPPPCSPARCSFGNSVR